MHINEALLIAYRDAGATSSNLVEAEYQALVANGAADGKWHTFLRADGWTGCLDEMMYAYLGDKGYAGTLSERLYQAAVALDLFGSSYATWNPDDKHAAIILSNNNLTAGIAPFSGWVGVRATLGKTTGKWSFEINYDAGVYVVAGLASASWALGTYYPGGDTNGIGFNIINPYWHIYNNGFVVPATNSAGAWEAGDIATVLWDADTGTLQIKRNGTALASSKTLPQFAGVEMFPAVGLYTSSDGCTANFGPLQYPEVGYNDGWYGE